MKSIYRVLIILLLFIPELYGQNQAHIWEKVELEFEASNQYENPYAEVDLWIQLEGPGFSKRCYGFWDGDNTWKIRIMATTPGKWTWTSFSNQEDRGLNNKTGSFTAIEWTEPEKKLNPIRRGMIQSTSNGHAFQFADGTPMFWLADTWWSCMTRRYRWYEDHKSREVGTHEAGFKDYVRFRKEQGFNGCMVIAAFPNWTDKESSWGGGDWEDEDGNRSFFGNAGKPDLNRINPLYFRNMDRKVDYLNSMGFIPFIETARRDISDYWKTEFGWPESYARYIRYICFRYQGNIIINSPIHLDAMALSGEEWNEASNIIIERYDWPPFGHLASANPPGSTLRTFGHTNQAKWLTFHSIGNGRDHHLFPGLTDMFYHSQPVPCLHNEPYYDGLKWGNDADQGSDLAAYYSRVALYGSVLSGALAGHVYGADHIWDGDDQMPDAFLIQSAPQMRYIYKFLSLEDKNYQGLKPMKHLLFPNQNMSDDNNMGWAYCMKNDASDLFLLYFEQSCKMALLSGAKANTAYQASWFDTSNGTWDQNHILHSNETGEIKLPDFPGGDSISNRDWALKLVEKGGIVEIPTHPFLNLFFVDKE